jgi:CheY-like chemotaxis protein
MDCKLCSYDLLLLDFRVRNVDRYELFERIRNIERKTRVCWRLGFASQRMQKAWASCKRHFVKQSAAIKDLMDRIN